MYATNHCETGCFEMKSVGFEEEKTSLFDGHFNPLSHPISCFVDPRIVIPDRKLVTQQNDSTS